MKNIIIFFVLSCNLLLSSCQDSILPPHGVIVSDNLDKKDSEVVKSKTLILDPIQAELSLRGTSTDVIFSASVYDGTGFTTKYYFSVEDILADVTMNDFPNMQEAYCYAENVLSTSDVMALQVASLAQIVAPSFFQGTAVGFIGNLRIPLQEVSSGCNGFPSYPLYQNVQNASLMGSTLLPANAPIFWVGGGRCEVRGCNIGHREFERLTQNIGYQVGKPTLFEFYNEWRTNVQPVYNCQSSRYIVYYNDEILNGEKFFLSYAIRTY
jgi:hypothetical protein